MSLLRPGVNKQHYYWKPLCQQGFRVSRLDGTVRLLAEREEIISKFNRTKDISVFLLTTGVGGVGLTLTAADRVVICK